MFAWPCLMAVPLLFLVIGCPDPLYEGNDVIEKTDDHMLLQCGYTSKRIHLVCRDYQWHPQIEACVPQEGG